MAEQLRVSLRVTAEHTVVVHLVGELDISVADIFAAHLAHAYAQADVRTVVIDLRELEFLGCAGIRVLLEAEHRCREDGLGFRVLATTRVVRRPLLLTGLDRALTLTSTDPPQRSAPGMAR